MEVLRQEILKKRKLLEDNQILNGKKYFKRSDLYKNISEESYKNTEEEDILDNNNSAVNVINDCEASVLPRKEVIRRYRERGEPILLFGESEMDAFKRLRCLEISAPEINRGLRNDFQAALEQVDQAYLNEILKAQFGEDKSNKDNDVKVHDTVVSLEEIMAMSKKMGRGSDELDCNVILDFLMLLLKLWGQKLNAREEKEKMSMKGKLASATYSQTQAYLKPLFSKLHKQTLAVDILDSLRDIVMHLLDRNYVQANCAYLQMAIGNAPWPIGVTMVGIHARTGREKIFSKNVAHVLNDETQRKFIQGLKRLMTKCQEFFPTDPSRCVEYNKN